MVKLGRCKIKVYLGYLWTIKGPFLQRDSMKKTCNLINIHLGYDLFYCNMNITYHSFGKFCALDVCVIHDITTLRTPYHHVLIQGGLHSRTWSCSWRGELSSWLYSKCDNCFCQVMLWWVSFLDFLLDADSTCLMGYVTNPFDEKEIENKMQK